MIRTRRFAGKRRIYMQRLKKIDGHSLVLMGLILMPLSSLLDRRWKHPAWIVIGGVGTGLAIAGLIQEFKEIKTDKR